MVEHREQHIEGPKPHHTEVGEVTRGAEVKVRNDSDLSRPENTVVARHSTGGIESTVVHPMSISTGGEGGDPKPVKSGDLERYKSKSLLELAKAGVIVDKTGGQTHADTNAKPQGDAAKPVGDAKPMETTSAQPPQGQEKHATLTVDAGSASKAAQAKPDILVKSDGTVEMHSNPETNGYKNVKIMMETKDDKTPPSKAQTEALAEITKHIAPEMQKNGPVEVVDKKALVPEKVVEDLGLVDGQTHSLPERTAENVRRLNNLDRQIKQSPGGSGMPASGDNGPDAYIPKREVPRGDHESDKMVTRKDIIAGIINADRAKPYESVRTNIDGSLALGRYGLNSQLLDYFMDELGEPPNEAMLAKLPKSLRDKLSTKEGRAAFREFASKLKAGGGADPKNQEFAKEFAQILPKESQEAIAETIIEKAGPKLGDDNAKIAFMFQTGQRPDQMTAANFEQPEFKQMETAVKRLGEMAQTRQHVREDKHEHISWDSHGKVGVGHGRWLSGDAGESFNAAQAEARQHGREIKLNSAGRTNAEQWALYRELKPRGARVATPGHSNHEKGNAIDVANYNDPVIRQILAKHGFEWGDGRGPMSDDLVHFKYTGRNNRTYNA